MNESEKSNYESNLWIEWLKFHETTLNQRFNFFVIFFGIIIASLVNTEDDFLRKAIVLVGLIIELLIALTLIRVQSKIDYIIEQLKTFPTTFAKEVSEQAKGKSVRHLIGYVIPIVCCIILFFALIIIYTTDLL